MGLFNWFKKKPSIMDLFAERHRANEENTRRIIDSMPGLIQAMYQQMNMTEIEKQGGVLHWEEVMYADDGEQQLVTLIGLIEYPPGTELMLDSGDIIKLTPTTAPYFKRLTRATIPIEMADKSAEEITEYFEKRKTESLLDQKKQNDLLQEFAESGENEEPMTFDEFDLTKLTEEQRKAYIMGSKPGKA